MRCTKGLLVENFCEREENRNQAEVGLTPAKGKREGEWDSKS